MASTGIAATGIYANYIYYTCCSPSSPCQDKPYTHGLSAFATIDRAVRVIRYPTIHHQWIETIVLLIDLYSMIGMGVPWPS